MFAVGVEFNVARCASARSVGQASKQAGGGGGGGDWKKDNEKATMAGNGNILRSIVVVVVAIVGRRSFKVQRRTTGRATLGGL